MPRQVPAPHFSKYWEIPQDPDKCTPLVFMHVGNYFTSQKFNKTPTPTPAVLWHAGNLHASPRHTYHFQHLYLKGFNLWVTRAHLKFLHVQFDGSLL